MVYFLMKTNLVSSNLIQLFKKNVLYVEVKKLEKNKRNCRIRKQTIVNSSKHLLFMSKNRKRERTNI